MHVVMGARTRLGVAVVRHLQSCGHVLVLSARHDVDVQALATLYPGSALFGPTCGDPPWPPQDMAVRLLVCAFGPVHPTRSAWSTDAAAFSTDVALAARIAACTGGPLHAVLVSSVLALAPPRDRCQYGGFKNLAEAQLAQALSHRPGARMSVLYPGRLSDTPTALGTSFDTLARRLCAQAGRPAAGSQVLGWDARLWLTRQALCGAASAITTRVSALPLEQRDLGPRQ